MPVYPRYRGEHGLDASGEGHMAGLSPLPRGTPPRTVVIYVETRFIPATAGNTTSLKNVSRARTVYPRYRGEHDEPDECGQYTAGLSPLPRGTRKETTIDMNDRRFIPATAGNTTCRKRVIRWLPVYPRYRGEHQILQLIFDHPVGLSPLPRGTLLQ